MQRGLLGSLDLSLGGVVGGLPVQCSGVFIYTSSKRGGIQRGCLSVGGPYAESIGELAWMDMPMLVRADAYDEKERHLQKKARVLPEVRLRQYVYNIMMTRVEIDTYLIRNNPASDKSIILVYLT